MSVFVQTGCLRLKTESQLEATPVCGCMPVSTGSVWRCVCVYQCVCVCVRERDAAAAVAGTGLNHGGKACSLCSPLMD